MKETSCERKREKMEGGRDKGNKRVAEVTAEYISVKSAFSLVESCLGILRFLSQSKSGSLN